MVRLTPNGLSVSERQRAISLLRSSGVGWVSAVMNPSAPALATAATSSARPTHCMPPCTIGCSTPTRSVNRVLIIIGLGGFSALFSAMSRQACSSGDRAGRGCLVVQSAGDIADADHPDQPVIVDHGHVADVVLVHQVPNVLQRILRGA